MRPLQPAERRRLQSRADARRAILDATEALLVEDGFEAFSMRRLAERCGYTAPTIYHYFGDKQRLHRRSCSTSASGPDPLAQARADGGDDGVENLRAFSLAFARFGLRNPTFYALLAQRRASPTCPPPPAAEEARAMMERPLDEARRRRAASPRTSRPPQQIVWAFLHGFVLLRTHRERRRCATRTCSRSASTRCCAA